MFRLRFKVEISETAAEEGHRRRHCACPREDNGLYHWNGAIYRVSYGKPKLTSQ